MLRKRLKKKAIYMNSSHLASLDLVSSKSSELLSRVDYSLMLDRVWLFSHTSTLLV